MLPILDIEGRMDETREAKIYRLIGLQPNMFQEFVQYDKFLPLTVCSTILGQHQNVHAER